MAAVCLAFGGGLWTAMDRVRASSSVTLRHALRVRCARLRVPITRDRISEIVSQTESIHVNKCPAAGTYQECAGIRYAQKLSAPTRFPSSGTRKCVRSARVTSDRSRADGDSPTCATSPARLCPLHCVHSNRPQHSASVCSPVRQRETSGGRTQQTGDICIER